MDSWNDFVQNINNLPNNINKFTTPKIESFMDLKYKLDSILDDICCKNTDFNIVKYIKKGKVYNNILSDTKNKSILLFHDKILPPLLKKSTYIPLIILLMDDVDIHMVSIIIDNKTKKIILFDNNNNNYNILHKIINKMGLNKLSYKIIQPSIKNYESKLGRCELCNHITYLFFIAYIKYNQSLDDFIKQFMNLKMEESSIFFSKFINYIEK